MKLRVIAVAALIVTLAPLIHAQNRTTSRSRTPQPKRNATTANIAVIDTTAFMDQKFGINRMMSAAQELNAKYEPLRLELIGMGKRLEAMRFDIKMNQGVQDPKFIAEQTAEADRLDMQIKQKAEEAQAKYNTDRVAFFDALQRDVTNALNAYAKTKGITLLFDTGRVPVLFSAPHVNITRDFIDEYNRTHPLTALPVTKPAAKP